jgi:hypothetical protein
VTIADHEWPGASLVRCRPALKVFYTSGYTENAIVHHGRLDAGVLLLAKPYRKSDLAETTEAVRQSVSYCSSGDECWRVGGALICSSSCIQSRFLHRPSMLARILSSSVSADTVDRPDRCKVRISFCCRRIWTRKRSISVKINSMLVIAHPHKRQRRNSRLKRVSRFVAKVGRNRPSAVLRSPSLQMVQVR